jgi:hypothetical protein
VLSRALPDRTGRVPSLPPPRPPRRVKRRAPLPPPPLDDEDARSDDDGESPSPAPPRPARAQTAGQSETDTEASRAAFDALRDVLRKRGNKDPKVLALDGWVGTRRRCPPRGSGSLGTWYHKFTDPDGETYRTLVSAACAAEPRAEGEESLLEEKSWAAVRHKRFAKLARWQRPAAVRDLAVPPAPVDPVPDAAGGFNYGEEWSTNGAHAGWLADSLAAFGGDIEDDRCEEPRALLAAACQKADVRPPAYGRNLPPATWMEDVEALAESEPDLAQRAALRELARTAAAIDLDCREAAKESAKRDWPAPRSCHLLATLCVFVIRTTEHRAVRIMDCEARLDDDDKIKLTWHGPNKPFDLDHLAWTEIARVWASGRVCYLFDFRIHHRFIGLSFRQ